MAILAWLKRVARRYIPESLAYYIKVIYYPTKLRKLDVTVEPELTLLEKIVRKNDRVVDVGANIGLYTMFLSKFVGEGGHVISLEPMPQTFRILKSNIKKMGLCNVECHRYAASNKSTFVGMNVPEYSDGGRNFYMAKVVGTENNSGTEENTVVQTVSLDTLLEPAINEICFIKCDVEGHELSCLQGSTEVLRIAQPIWMIEVSGNPEDVASDAFQVLDLMGQYGYRTCIWKNDRLRVRRQGDQAINYWFLAEKHLSRLESWGLELNI